MVTIIEAHEVPRARIKCPNCKSILEYGNADLNEVYETCNQTFTYPPSKLCHKYSFRCPQCGVDVSANKIIPKEQ